MFGIVDWVPCSLAYDLSNRRARAGSRETPSTREISKFTTASVRDLRVYADALNGSVSHYLDRNGLECDAVVHLRNGASGLVEVKLGGESLIDEGAATLNVLSGLVDTSRQKEVAFKMVVTATGDSAYQRPDGIIVCPIGCLKP